MLCGERAGLGGELVGAVLVDLAGGGVEGDGDLWTGLVAGGGDGLEDEFDGGLVAGKRGGEAAFVAEAGGEAAVGEDAGEGVVDLDDGADRFAEAGQSDGRDHEFLEVGAVRGVGPAVRMLARGTGRVRASVPPSCW